MTKKPWPMELLFHVLFFGPWTSLHCARPPSLDPPCAGPPPPDLQNFALFFTLPPQFSFFLPSLGGRFVNFGGVFEAPGPSNVHVWRCGGGGSGGSKPPTPTTVPTTTQQNTKMDWPKWIGLNWIGPNWLAKQAGLRLATVGHHSRRSSGAVVRSPDAPKAVGASHDSPRA